MGQESSNFKGAAGQTVNNVSAVASRNAISAGKQLSLSPFLKHPIHSQDCSGIVRF